VAARWRLNQCFLRSDVSDLALISQNTGWSSFKIDRIKNHIFFDDTHVIIDAQKDVERIGRFHADPEIANAWSRLIRSDSMQNDVDLLNHEYFESKVEKLFKLDYHTAHNFTVDVAKRPWNVPN
jgi:hypothetical protein